MCIVMVWPEWAPRVAISTASSQSKVYEKDRIKYIERQRKTVEGEK